MNKQPEIPNPNSEIIRVLLIEDNPGDVHLIKDALDNVNAVTFNLECFNRLSTGLERLAGGGIDVVLLDLLLPDSQGLDSFTKIYAQAPKVPIIVLTGNKDEALAINAMREGAQDYLVKGQMDDNLLGRTIRYAIERKRAEEALRESEERYRSFIDDVIDVSAVGVFILDKDFRVIWVNQALERFFGMQRDKVTGQDKRELIRERIKHRFEDPEAFAETVLATYNNNNYLENFECHVLPHGEREDRWLEHWSRPIRSGLYAGGRIEIYYDITERKRGEEALKESEDKFRNLAEQSPNMIFINKNGNVVYANEKCEEIMGYRRDEFYSPDFDYLSLVSPESIKLVKSKFANHMNNEEVEPYEYTLITKDGRRIEAIVNTTLINYEGERTILGTITDITERKRAEEALQREKHAVQRLAEEREAVAKIGRIIGSTLEIEKVYELFAEEVRKIIPFDRIGINIIYPERDIFTIAYIAGRDVEGHRPGDVSPMAGSLTEEVVRTRSSLLIQIDHRDEVEGRFPGLLPNFQAGFRSFMAVPLISKDQVIGVLHLQSVKPNAYITADVNLAESIGSQIAGAIANAQLYQELKRQWAFSATLIDTMSEGMGVLDEKGQLEFGNRRLFQMLGYSLEESVGMHWTSLVHPDDHGVMKAQGASGKNPRSSSYECRMLCKGGTSVPVLISWAPRFDDQGQQRGSVGIVTDLTERKRTERRLREYEARYSHLLDHMPDGVALSRRGRIIRVNPPMARMFGYPSPEKIEGLYTWDLAAPVSKEIMRQRSTLRALGQQGKNRFEFQALRRDGLSFPAEVTLTVDRSEPQPFVLIIIRDVTERKKHENQRKLLSDRIITAQEKERTLIARELHDELGQALTGIKMDMAWIKGHMKGQDDAVSQRFMALGELIDSSIESVRKMATSLRPSILDRLGLAAAIEWHANEFERRTGIECIIESLASDFNITSKTAINAYRIFQEALTNVARHAGASRVDVRMIEDRENLTICISDDGRGISSGKFSGPTSLGIAGMRERAELVNGRLDIKSQKGKGTRVTAYLPLSPNGSKP